MALERSSGLLLHISSLPSYGGIGDLGPAAYAFADFLAAAKQRLWQVLPLSPTGFGNSPYAALSAFAGNPLLISLEKLVEARWIGRSASPGFRAMLETCTLKKWNSVSGRSCSRPRVTFCPTMTTSNGPASSASVKRMPSGCTITLATVFCGRSFCPATGRPGRRSSPTGIAKRCSNCSRRAGTISKSEQAIQFAFDEQWKALRSYCAERDIRFIGDVAIFVNYDSADVWTHPEIFELRRRPYSDSRCRCAPGLFQRDRPALGQSDLQMGRAGKPRASTGGWTACAAPMRSTTLSGSITFAGLKPSGHSRRG